MGEILKVSDLTKEMVGKRVLLDASIKGADKVLAKNGSYFLNIVLGDKDTELAGKMWNVQDSVVDFTKSNKFIRASVSVGEFNGKLQFIMDKCGPIPEGELDEGQLVKKAPESVEGMIEELEGVIDGLQDEAIRIIVKRRYDKVKDKFIEWPAARSHHHNYPTGLLFHTVSMLRLAKNNLRQYPGKLDGDIVLGAIVLHDMDKIYEYSSPEKPEFTEIGKLMGHIFLAGANVYAEAERLKAERSELDLSKVKHLIHAILAHHGKLEWGSPVVPKTIEAEIVHQIDMMDSRMSKEY